MMAHLIILKVQLMESELLIEQAMQQMYKVIQQGLLITSNYYPWGETLVYASLELFHWHLIFQFHPKGHLCLFTDSTAQLEPVT